MTLLSEAALRERVERLAAIVEQFAENDPYVLEGLVTARRIEPWAVVA